MIETDVDYAYLMEKEKYSCSDTASGRCTMHRGKMLGGTNQINALLYVRGNKNNYDGWFKDGNYGWDYRSVLEYFKKSQNLGSKLDKNVYTSEFHGRGGYMNVEDYGVTYAMEMKAMKAATEAGFFLNPDFNGKEQLGFGCALGTAKNGVRQSTQNTFLTAAKSRPNLDVIINTVAQKLMIEDKSGKKRAVGVIVKLKNGVTKKILTRAEVLLSAGTIESPKLLMLSGIGPKNHLSELGIPCMLDLQVGCNYHDHNVIIIPFTYSCKCADAPSNLGCTLGKFIENGKGSLAKVPNCMGFTTPDSSGVPQIQHIFVIHETKAALYETIKKYKLAYNITLFDQLINNQCVMSMVVNLLSPESRGRIRLRSSTPSDPPIINPQYLSSKNDRNQMISGILEALKFLQTPTFRQCNVTPIPYPTNCDKFTNQLEMLQCMITKSSTGCHPVGTCKMGSAADASAVVDPELRVHGINGIRVIDASIIPKIPACHTNAPVVMIAEKGADMIKEFWKNKVK